MSFCGVPNYRIFPLLLFSFAVQVLSPDTLSTASCDPIKTSSNFVELLLYTSIKKCRSDMTRFCCAVVSFIFSPGAPTSQSTMVPVYSLTNE